MPNQADVSFKYSLAGIELEHTFNEKDIGVQVVPYIKLNNQHKKLLNKANQRTGIIRRNYSLLIEKSCIYLLSVHSLSTVHKSGGQCIKLTQINLRVTCKKRHIMDF